MVLKYFPNEYVILTSYTVCLHNTSHTSSEQPINTAQYAKNAIYTNQSDT